MASTSEQGHAINVANFQTLIINCIGFGDKYNPVIDAIKIPALQTKYDKAKQKLNLTDAKNDTLNSAINDRQEAFKGLDTLCTQVTNAFAVSGASKPDIDDLISINKKIQGPSKKKKTQTTPDEQTPKQISTSQQSFDSKLNFYKTFIQFLENKPVYNPNETELKIEALKNKFDLMEEKNKAVDQELFNYNTAKNSRNEELYNPTAGLVQTAKEVKKYVKSIFKATSPEFKQINSIEFKTFKK